MNDAPGMILVVDDVEAKRYLLATWLLRAGHQVIEATTGQEALDRVSAADLVILDVNLPDMSGFEVCRQIRSNPLTVATPIVQVSATAVAVADRAHGLTQGADAYLIDPAEPDELIAVVTAILRYYRARHRAERTASLLKELASVTLDINAAETFDQLASVAVSGAARIFGTPAVLFLELPDGQVRRTSAASPGSEPVRHGGRAGLVDRVAGQVLEPNEASAVGAVSGADWRRLVPESVLQADICLAAARTKRGRPPVAIAVDREGFSGEDEQHVLRQLVQSVALSIEALRSYAEEHMIALTLQRSFLPTSLPEIPGFAMSTRYIPASDQAAVGGDFYEALIVPGRVLIAIGDVQGHSLHAATVMGELRHALRAYASEGHSPAAITGLVNAVLQRYHPGIIATLCLVLLDPATGNLEIVNCGHLPILMISGPEATYVGEGGLMLGLPVNKPHTETAYLPEGGTAVLITDGLVEERRISLDVNLEKLRTAVRDADSSDVEALSNHLLSLFGAREDDVAMIVLHRARQSCGDPSEEDTCAAGSSSRPGRS
jgi:serine phosphatase RsbU (regulator of sigma subunit)/DNA-binding response OmpR family regulator